MTVDELLAKLDAEHENLESQLPAHYQAYGRFKYWYPEDTRSFHNDKYDLDKKLARQKEIRAIQSTLRRETIPE